jgi:hypothetical protein
MRSLPSLLLTAVLTLAPEVRAQEDAPSSPRPERLYLNTGVLLGSTRMVGLGGASVGIAEGAEGSLSNLAALAHRSPRLEREWDLNATLSFLDVPLARARNRDLDNDGLPDDAPRTFQFMAGMLLQLKHVGMGFFLNTRSVTYCATAACGAGETIQATLTDTALAGALALGRDDFLIGVGFHSAGAVFSHGGEDWRYSGTGLALDVLYRPNNRPYRLGLAVRPQVVGHWKPAPGQAPLLAGRQLYAAVVAPGVLSLGVSWRMGEGAEHYNRLSPAARRQLRATGDTEGLPPELPEGAPVGRWLVTAQLDAVDAVEGAVPVRAFTGQRGQEAVGDFLMLQPRLGVEHETWPGRLRTRLGGFVEPSPFARTGERPHVTGGFELFLFRYLEDWALSASFDVARRYSNFGLSVGFWR